MSTAKTQTDTLFNFHPVSDMHTPMLCLQTVMTFYGRSQTGGEKSQS